MHCNGSTLWICCSYIYSFTEIYKGGSRDRRELPGTTAPWLSNNTHFCYDGESAPIITTIKNNTSYSIRKTKKKYQKKLTQTGERIGFTAVFTDITIKGAAMNELKCHKMNLKKI